MLSRLGGQIAEIGRNVQVALRFQRRRRGDLEETDDLLARALSAALRDVRRNGERRSTKLSGDHPMIRARKPSRQLAREDRERPCALPDVKPSKIVHARS